MYKTTIQLMPDAAGHPRPEILLSDLCSFNVTQAGWLRVALRNPANPDYLEVHHYPPHQVASIVEVKL